MLLIFTTKTIKGSVLMFFFFFSGKLSKNQVYEQFRRDKNNTQVY